MRKVYDHAAFNIMCGIVRTALHGQWEQPRKDELSRTVKAELVRLRILRELVVEPRYAVVYDGKFTRPFAKLEAAKIAKQYRKAGYRDAVAVRLMS